MGNNESVSKINPHNFIIMGPQGCGKGTQAELLQNKLNGYYLVMGDLCRDVSHEDSQLGQQVKQIIDEGSLLSDEMVLNIFKSKLHLLPKDNNIIFDGIPRSLEQGKLLDKALLDAGINLPKVILINISRMESTKRLLSRKVCSKCYHPYLPEDEAYSKEICDECGSKLITREDDHHKSIEHRLDLYYSTIEEINDYYITDNRLITINGEQSIEGVSNEISSKIKDLIK